MGPEARRDHLGGWENAGPTPAPRKYPDELRERAVREVQTSGRPVAYVARDLGIHKEALRQWVRQAEADQGDRLDLLTTDETTGIALLRKENESACRELGPSVSVYNARRRRPKSARSLPDEQLLTKIRAVPVASGETYGARRIHRRLRREGVIAARCTIERLMREDGLEGVIRGRRRRPTVPEPAAPRPPDLVNRQFTATRPNQLWLADLTCVRNWSGQVYGAFVLGIYSRTIAG
ncbi:IS3 family transposase [Streptomyces sp. NPDC086549]|uniref:IS3 family transposase n=1 Tax=Streptomyces sp. NPDC086549 TaxID=3365752 RepID=UPI00380A2C27